VSTSDRQQPGGDWQEPGAGSPQGGGPPAALGVPAWLKMVVVLIFLAALGWVLLLLVQFCTEETTTGPSDSVPGVTDQDKGAPKYVRSLYDVARPLGVAVSGDGNIYVTESAGERFIRVFNRDGKLLNSLVAPGTTERDRLPLYVAIGGQGRVYVSDGLRNTIDIFNADGSYNGAFAPTAAIPAEEWVPLALAFDRKGDLYVTLASEARHQVAVFDSSGNLKLRFGQQGQGDGEFWFPNGIAADSQGRIYVSDSNNGRVQAFDAQGKFLYAIRRGYAKGDLSFPRGITVDDKNRLFVVDTVRHAVNVYRLADSPAFIYSFGDAGIEDGEFLFPNALALDDSGRLYVTDRENGRIQVWSY